jgi:chromosome segregation protein
VFGESSAHSLRSDKMDDVIFGGSSIRKPLSMAEVNLTFSQIDTIPGVPDNGDLTIKRIIYRDGQNQYFIDDGRVKKHELVKLFMDTGIGKSGYFIMEQGKVDMILSSSPEERRYIFEEAAGISLYKLQLKKTESRLTATENNLLRIKDILVELEREYKLKKKQAEKTKKYFSLEEIQKGHALKINFIKLRKLKIQISNIEKKLSKLKNKKEDLSEKLKSVDSQNEKFETQREEIRKDIFRTDKDLELLKAKKSTLRVYIDNAASETREIKNKRIATESQLKKIQDSLKDIRGNIEKFKQLELDLSEHIKNVNSNLGKEKGEKENISLEIRIKKDNLLENNSRIETLKADSVDIRNQINLVIHELISEIEKTKSEMIQNEMERKELSSKIKKTLEKILTQLESSKDFLNKPEIMLNNNIRNQNSESIKILIEEYNQVTAILQSLVHDDAVLHLNQDFNRFEKFEDGFRSLIFDEQGVHARKVGLDQKLEKIISEINSLEQDNFGINEYIEIAQKRQEKVSTIISALEADLRELATRKESVYSNQKSTLSQLNNLEEQEKYFINILNSYNQNYENVNKKVNEYKFDLHNIEADESQLEEMLNAFIRKNKEIDVKIQSGKDFFIKEREELDNLYPKISQVELNLNEFNINFNNLSQDIYNNYTLSFTDLIEKFKDKVIDIEKETSAYNELKEQLRKIGQVNPLALEEYYMVEQMYEQNIKQKKDIENGRRNLLNLIEEIKFKASDRFSVTFKEVQKNFGEIFSKLFIGGKGEMFLSDETRPLDSGIEVYVQPPGKKPKTLKMLSGGERAMTAVAILFATFKVKSAPFCFLDEIDAPWDENNIGLFINMLRDFMSKSQFIIITHAKMTMAVADQILGVTIEEPGISKLVGLKMDTAAQKSSNDMQIVESDPSEDSIPSQTV